MATRRWGLEVYGVPENPYLHGSKESGPGKERGEKKGNRREGMKK